MANCPIQIVMNASEFIKEDVKPHGGGNHKEYYAHRDEDFVAHKQRFSEQLSVFAAAQQQNSYTKLAYAKVVLEHSAIAKSNHPTGKVLTAKNGCKVVGGNRKGEMLVRFSPSSVQKISEGLSEAEDKVAWVYDERKKKEVPKPSQWRSEVGAIKDILPISAADKCLLTAEEIVSYVKEYGRGYIYVELFENTLDKEIVGTEDEGEYRKMFSSFVETLRDLPGLKAFKSSLRTAQRCYVMYMTKEKETIVNLKESITSSAAPVTDASADEIDYDALLDILTAHPLVKEITIAPIVQNVPKPSFRFDEKENVIIPKPDNLENYPIIGVADSGISAVLNDWVVSRLGIQEEEYRDESHGTFISGLYITGKLLNSNFIKEKDGNRLVEICVLPKDKWSYFQVYPKGVEDFLIKLRSSVSEAVAKTGVRIIGLSLNIPDMRMDFMYSKFAMELDDIAMSQNVLFVISAGNLMTPHQEWIPGDTDANIAEFTSRNDDIVYQPAESIRNMSVGALNPPDNLGLTCYTCKGKGLATGTKPDMVHVGGFGCDVDGVGKGLYSINNTGQIVSWSGTSFSAPMIAKTLAALDYQIEGDTPRETLMALVIHSGRIPGPFTNKKYKPYLKDWIGFGMPNDSDSILNGTEHSISLVFHNSIMKGQVLSFPFSWPASLVKEGKCMGRVKLTVVCTPQLAYKYGEEFVREDVRVSLCQMKANGKKHASILEPIYNADKNIVKKIAVDEEDQRDSLYKWNPVKVYEKEFVKGEAVDTNLWKLEARYADREEVTQAVPGLVFTIILTIEDSEQKAPIYNEMRQALTSAGVTVSDIQTAVRVMPRV